MTCIFGTTYKKDITEDQRNKLEKAPFYSFMSGF